MKKPLSRAYHDTVAMFAVDNIRFSEQGLELLAAVDRGEISRERAIEMIEARARAYAQASANMRSEKE